MLFVLIKLMKLKLYFIGFLWILKKCLLRVKVCSFNPNFTKLRQESVIQFSSWKDNRVFYFTRKVIYQEKVTTAIKTLQRHSIYGQVVWNFFIAGEKKKCLITNYWVKFTSVSLQLLPGDLCALLPSIPGSVFSAKVLLL